MIWEITENMYLEKVTFHKTFNLQTNLTFFLLNTIYNDLSHVQEKSPVYKLHFTFGCVIVDEVKMRNIRNVLNVLIHVAQPS